MPGLGSVEAGSLGRAREPETFGFLQLTHPADEKVGWTGGLSVVTWRPAVRRLTRRGCPTDPPPSVPGVSASTTCSPAAGPPGQ
ncbi:hypothetical protein [Streptomyces pactum]|uniref:Uncharacterized protein n=1 Tax=Streptomyces pactum TaxID=68249 RepID=A0A1S6JIF3_9ACTN|nr:hypothetical protein [Streptomyces pactum]AQS71502.1 hypothetical protein B1H29_35750 [Streptomyces pactum]